jgi:hypothetical protein
MVKVEMEIEEKGRVGESSRRERQGRRRLEIDDEIKRSSDVECHVVVY